MTEWGFSEAHQAHMVERGFGEAHDGTECGCALWRKNFSPDGGQKVPCCFPSLIIRWTFSSKHLVCLEAWLGTSPGTSEVQVDNWVYRSLPMYPWTLYISSISPCIWPRLNFSLNLQLIQLCRYLAHLPICLEANPFDRMAWGGWCEQRCASVCLPELQRGTHGILLL